MTDTFFKLDSQSNQPVANTCVSIEADTSQPVDTTTQEEAARPSTTGPSVARTGNAGDFTDGEGGLLCTVCMDSCADTVMMPCAHGGICYSCADALIRKYLLLGGAKCVHCRTPIESLVKLSDIDNDIAQGIEIEIPKAILVVRRNV